MVKVLFAGDCGGKVEVLFKRVATVNASAAGPFDVLLCTGGFFAATGKRWLPRAMKCGVAVQAAMTRLMGHYGRDRRRPGRRSLSPCLPPLRRRRLPPAASALLTLAPPAFVSPAGPDDDDYTGELLPYITGEKQAPLPTYFIGGWGQGSKQALEALPGASGGWGWWQGGPLPGASRHRRLCSSRSRSYSI